MDAAKVATDVQAVVNLHGVESVRKALEYIASFPINSSVSVLIRMWSKDSFECVVNAAQYQRIKASTQVGNKIEAIKYLRSVTSIGLKEAKDVVENMAYLEWPEYRA